jgi:serpin B
MKKNISFVYFSLLSIILLLVLITLTQCSPGTTEPEKNNDIRALSKTEKDIVSSSAGFGLNLIKEISKSESGKNIIISPLNVSTAFGMALNGAVGNTYEQMKFTLGLEVSNQNEVNESYKSLNELLTGIDNKVAFSSANSIWYRTGFLVESPFIDVNKKYFNAEVNELDFSDPAAPGIINDWVKRSTNSKIEKIIEQIDRAMVMYLINAIYFKGTWKYQFDKNFTRDDLFYVSPDLTVTCKMMTQKNNFSYYSTANYKAVELPYGDGSYNMMVLLPHERIAVDNLLLSLTPEEFSSIKNNFTERELTLFLPKFKLEYERKLNDDLINLGMNDAFNPDKADFTKINKNGGIFISEVKHKTFVDVNEEGTEAAAVTSIGIGLTSVNDKQIRIDRPFLFIIYEKNTNTILFIGKIINPT